MPVFVRLASYFGTTMAEQIKFNYAVGHLWNVNEPDGAVSTYTFHNTVFFGTMADARGLQAYCNKLLDEETQKRNPYKIYKLVELPDYPTE
jgi:hypothetical protein